METVIGRAMHIPRDRKLKAEIVEWLDQRALEKPHIKRVFEPDWLYEGEHFTYSISQGSIGHDADTRLTFMIMIYDMDAQIEFKLAWADKILTRNN